MPLILDSGDKIRGDASVATVVDYTLHGLDNNVLKQLADGQLASGIGDLYTADSLDVVSLITLVNTDSSARTVNLYLTPNGGTARRLIPKNLSLGAGSSLCTDGARITVIDASGQVLSTWAVDDTPVDGETNHPISSNWAYDHENDTTVHGATGAVVGTTNSQTLTNKTLTSPTINGTIATTGLTMPAFTLGGNLDANNRELNNVHKLQGRTDDALFIVSFREATDRAIRFWTTGVSPGFAATERMNIYGGAAEVDINFLNSVLKGIKLGGALTLNGQVFDAGSGSAQINSTVGWGGLVIQGTRDDDTAVRITGNVIRPAGVAGDRLFQFLALGRSSTGVERTYGGLTFHIADPANGAEGGRLEFFLMTGGALNDPTMTLSGAGTCWADEGFDADEYFKVAGTQVVSAQGAAVANPTDASSTQARLTDLLGRLRTHGLIAT